MAIYVAMTMFVGRAREMAQIKEAVEVVRHGQGKFLIIEGPAGVGKTALVEESLKSMQDFKIFRVRARAERAMFPYSMFFHTFGFESVEDISGRHSVILAENIASDIKKEERIFIDEKRGIVSRKLFEELGGGLYISATDGADVLITETNINDGISPYELESRILDRMEEYAKFEKHPVILIDGINYLIFTVGIERVLMALRDFMHKYHGILICTGDLSVIESPKRIKALFDKVYHFGDTGFRDSQILIFTAFPQEIGVIFSEKSKTHRVSEDAELRPSMLRFKLLEEIIKALKKGDITINCLRDLLDYNTIDEVYVWLKYVKDVAMSTGHRVYVYAGNITSEEQKVFDSLIDHFDNPQPDAISAYRVYESLATYLGRLAETKPLCVVMEDVQWADSNSMMALDYLARNPPPRVLFIMTYRGENVALTARAKIIRNMADYEDTIFIRLPPLSREDAMKLMGNCKNSDEIYRRSGGNPLLLKEILRLRGKGENFVPDTIKESIEHQVQTLDDTTLYYLRFLAAMGSSVDTNLADNILGSSWKSEIAGVDGLLDYDGKAEFNSTVVWEYVHSTTPPDLKSEFHRRIGDYYSTGDVYLAAHHYYMARDRRAIEYLTAAAGESEKMYAFDTAIQEYEKALEICRKFGDEKEPAILEKLADVEELTGRYTDAVRHYMAAFEKTEKTELLLKLARAQSSLGEYQSAKESIDKFLKRGPMNQYVKELLGTINLRTGNMELAERYFKECMQEAEENGTKKQRADAYMHMALLKYYQSKFRDALEYAKKALVTAEEEGNYQQVISIYNLMGAVYDVLGKPERALEKYKMVQHLAEKAGDIKGMALAYNNIGILYYTLGNLKMVKTYLEKARDLHQKMGDKRSIALSYYNLSGVYADTGDFKRAIEYATKALKLYRDMGNVQYVGFTELWLGTYKLRIMEIDDANKHLEQAWDIAEEKDLDRLRFMVQLARIRLNLRTGNLKKAVDILKDCKGPAEEMRGDVDVYPEYLLIGFEVMIKIGDAVEYDKFGRELENVLSWHQDRFLLGMYLVWKAIKNVKFGGDPWLDFNTGIAHIKRQGYISSYGEMQYEFGKALLESGNEKGKEHLRIAKIIFKNAGIEPLVREIQNMCHKC